MKAVYTGYTTAWYFDPPMQWDTVNNESLEGLKFGESTKKSIWRKKVWRIYPHDR